MLRNGLEPWHLLIVGIVVILLFGSRKLPDTARALGKSLRILKSETKAMKNDDAGATPPPGPQEPAAPYASFHTPGATSGPAPAPAATTAPAPSAPPAPEPAAPTPASGGPAAPAAHPLPTTGTTRPAASGGSAPAAVPVTDRGTGGG
ncbi:MULTISPECIES: Sec-independent protein translocase subunit TatA [Streptomyces]|uniref:Sec-independent protein translocase protein TatA n=1 Tax=Streptomyces ramulosus TaxID=47762 RepID=A0ABW1FH80_9ACTN